jgi:hypothetical protein
VRAIQEEILPLLRIEWIDKEVHALAMAVLLAAGRRKLSLVDCCSFLGVDERASAWPSRSTGTSWRRAFDFRSR